MSLFQRAAKLLRFAKRYSDKPCQYLLNMTGPAIFCSQSSRTISNEYPMFPGARAHFVGHPKLTLPSDISPVPIYRVMDSEGCINDPTQDPQLEKDVVQKMYHDMVLLNIMDKILYESQRQGRISFYMTNFGEEATQVGSAAALELRDLIYGQYREAGVLVWRGFTIDEFLDQCFGNADDIGRGKQMPCHYGSKDLNFVTISSPLATQMPQAVGAAYAMKMREGNDACVVCYFGEGAASEGDAHAAFNFAAILDCPIILFCRNNGYAISTPASEQYSGDGIAGRGAAYGIASIRVDGTDIFAVYNAMKLCRKYVLEHNKPIIFEAMTYRVGHHSTSDDSTAYRSSEEIEAWNSEANPITRLKNYLKRKEWYDEAEEKNFIADTRKKILKQLSVSEGKPKPNWKEMFKDVYAEMPIHLKEQMQELEKSIEAHDDYYPSKNFQS